MRTTLVAVLAAVGVVLVGCSNSDPATTEDTAARAPARTAATKTTSPPAPASAFAEVVAELAPTLRQSASDADADCMEESAAACQDAYRTFGQLARQLHDRLADRHRPSSETYVGAPADEITSLLQDTESLADRAAIMANTYETAQCLDTVSSCIQERVFAQVSSGELMQKLAAWDAHI